MAKGKSDSGAPDKRTNAKLGDIYTAAKSTMEPADYSKGYPTPEGALHNTNFSGKRPGGK